VWFVDRCELALHSDFPAGKISIDECRDRVLAEAGRFAPLSRVEGVLGKDVLLPWRGAGMWSVFGGTVTADELSD
jgi:hypothetical protein